MKAKKFFIATFTGFLLATQLSLATATETSHLHNQQHKLTNIPEMTYTSDFDSYLVPPDDLKEMGFTSLEVEAQRKKN